MRVPVLILALATASPLLAQYTATTLTRKVAPRPERPAPAAPARVPGAPAAGVVQAAPPANPAKAKAEEVKKEEARLAFQRQRAEAGSPSAQYELGLRYFSGNGVEKDEKVGRAWIEKAAANNHIPAKKMIEEMDSASKKSALFNTK